MTPRVSVVLPVRNAAETLGACLASVARQRERRFECLVLDDGSEDASREIAEAFVRRDARFRVLPGERRGLVPALRRGVEAAQAPIVARMDADDWMHRDRLGVQCDALDANLRLDAVGCHARSFPRSALGPGDRAYEAWLASIDGPRRIQEECFVECPVAHPTLALRREALLSDGYRDAGWAEDYDLVLRWLSHGRRIGVVPRRLLGWRHGEGRLSRTDPTYASERFTACKAHYLARGFLARHAEYALWGYGGTGRTLAAALREHGRVPARIAELHPGRLGQKIHGAPVVTPDALGPPGRLPLLVSVAGAIARERIRRALARMGYRDCVDFVCTA